MDKFELRLSILVVANVLILFLALHASLVLDPRLAVWVWGLGVVSGTFMIWSWLRRSRARKLVRRPLVSGLDAEQMADLTLYSKSTKGRLMILLRLGFYLPTFLLFYMSSSVEGIDDLVRLLFMGSGFVWIFVGSWLYNRAARRAILKRLHLDKHKS